MSIALADSPKFTISRTGLEVHDHLSFEEWSALAPHLGEAARGVAFVIGDWLIYGKERFGEGKNRGTGREIGPRVATEDYETVITLTGLDRATLHAYAHVARRVPSLLRNKLLSWEHHKVVAKLPPEGQERWLKIAEENPGGDGRPVSTRRLRRSISAGRLLETDEVNVPENDRGIENHIPFVNRLVAWWARMRDRDWHKEATAEQRAAVKRDLEPIVAIYNEL